LAVAIKAFNNEYQVWPQTLSDLTSSGANNPRKIRFFNTASPRNPWDKVLKYAIDKNDDGKIDVADGNLHTPTKVIKASVAAWSEIPGEGKEAANSWTE